MAIENVNRNDSLSGIAIIYTLTKCRCLVLTVR